ncbi:hypothetical protein SELMODRAFT_102245 [Selaginella moellendorffii]|uniref:F-box domain-containing protein n=1 Tax=Selaginella moellendorffii TaxID=88036 RepID=D8RUX4_SELML|nr:hypothetical protein SELMODRAFT_102245 [Selaginella moellendorffii]
MIFLVDPFDSLPDSLLLLIFNKVSDVKSLGRCCAVSKRFYSLARTVDNVVVKVDCVISGDEAGHLSARGKGFFGHLLKFFGSMVRPLQALQHLLVPKRALVASTSAATTAAADVSHHSPGEVLKNFRDLEHLRIELPGGELEIEDGFLLKWKARYGSTLESCVILGASALINSGDQSTAEDDGNLPDADGGFKLRVVWTISSLIAASGRHYLLQNIIAEHPSLQSLVLTDADGQGMLCMDKEQLQQSRDKPLPPSSASSNRTQVPSLNVKLWYAPHIELPGGVALKGATLVSIRPSGDGSGGGGGGDGDGNHRVEVEAFEQPFQTAAEELVKRRTYLLEMKSF